MEPVALGGEEAARVIKRDKCGEQGQQQGKLVNGSGLSISFKSSTITRKADTPPDRAPKPNQDAYTCKVQATCAHPTAMFAVADGHGVNGHKASWLVAHHLQSSSVAVEDIR